MSNHYINENDPFAVKWLRELMADGLIPTATIDPRSICDVQPDDVRGYTQCHFFGGIGGWCEALRLAGWRDDRSVWSGSCPCQPFSCAGKGKGEADSRHLWPELRRLIAECLPSAVFGEQVASKAGREWLSGVRADLEALGYVVGAADLCAASAGAPHIRQRLYWVAHAQCRRCWESGATGRGRSHGDRYGVDVRSKTEDTSVAINGLSDAACNDGRESGRINTNAVGPIAEASWHDSRPVLCLDGKYRRVPTQPEIFPLASRVSNRVGILRGAGNSIVPQVAAEFIRAFLEASSFSPSPPVYSDYSEKGAGR